MFKIVCTVGVMVRWFMGVNVRVCVRTLMGECCEDVMCPLEFIGRCAFHCVVPNLGRRTLMVCVCLWLAGQGPMDRKWMGTNEPVDVCPSGACRN